MGMESAFPIRAPEEADCTPRSHADRLCSRTLWTRHSESAMRFLTRCVGNLAATTPFVGLLEAVYDRLRKIQRAAGPAAYRTSI